MKAVIVHNFFITIKPEMARRTNQRKGKPKKKLKRRNSFLFNSITFGNEKNSSH
jgi:hypothetical protein